MTSTRIEVDAMANKKPLAAFAAIGLAFAVSFAVWAMWQVQGTSMRGDFVRALQSGKATQFNLELRDKTWSEEELSTADVIKVPTSAGKEQSLIRAVHSQGRVFLSGHEYLFQGSVRDSDTGLVHLFGFQRRDPQHWRWARYHPDSQGQHLDRRMKQLEDMKKQYSR